MQYKISSLLAEDYPQLAFEVFSAAWHRITTTGIHGHAHMLFYLPPWLEAIDFAVLPSDATVSLLEVRHPITLAHNTHMPHIPQMLIPWNVEYVVAFQNLCTLTFKYGSFQPFLLERLWAQLVARYRANIASILQFIVQTILQTVHAPPSSSFPPHQSVLLTVCGRARGVCRVVSCRVRYRFVV
jgi:hypothetical protein